MSAWSFADKVAVVTGGASGIGLGIARCLAAEVGGIAVATDVTDLASVRRLASSALERFGRVDVVCNNAGVGPMAPVARLTMDDWRWMIDVNLYGVVHGVHVFLPLLEANPEGGRLMNTASMAGLAPVAGLGAYALAKAGVIAMTEVLADELSSAGSGVRATVLCPGAVRTRIQESQRNRPRVGDEALVDVDITDRMAERGLHFISPDQAGAAAVAALRTGSLYAITHPEWYPQVQARQERLAAAFASSPEASPPPHHVETLPDTGGA